MSEIKRWSGNTTTEVSLYDDELDNLCSYIKEHPVNYILGKGYIGSALMKYCIQADLYVDGMIDTSELDSISNKDNCGIIIGVSDKYLIEITKLLEERLPQSKYFLLSSSKRDSIGKSFDLNMVKKDFWINIFVTNTCNLFCRSCSTFSPICHDSFYDVNQFKKDIGRVCIMDFETISILKFTGGEAFLHPDIFTFFSIAREYYPTIPIECYTNGSTLLRFSADKLDFLSKNKIVPVITEYPVDRIDYSTLYKKLNEARVDYEVIYSEKQKYFSKRPINLSRNTPKHLFYQCPRYKMCDSVFLYEGRMYKCIYALSSQAFNKAFGTNLELLPGDYVDIYNSKAENVYEYCMKRLPFCGYCSPIEEVVEWGLSSKSIKEWT